MDLSRMKLAVTSMSKEEDNYVKYCRDFEMNPEWVHKQFKNNLSGNTYTLLGLVKKGATYSIKVHDNSLNIDMQYSIHNFKKNCSLIND